MAASFGWKQLLVTVAVILLLVAVFHGADGAKKKGKKKTSKEVNSSDDKYDKKSCDGDDKNGGMCMLGDKPKDADKPNDDLNLNHDNTIVDADEPDSNINQEKQGHVKDEDEKGAAREADKSNKPVLKETEEDEIIDEDHEKQKYAKAEQRKKEEKSKPKKPEVRQADKVKATTKKPKGDAGKKAPFVKTQKTGKEKKVRRDEDEGGVEDSDEEEDNEDEAGESPHKPPPKKEKPRGKPVFTRDDLRPNPKGAKDKTFKIPKSENECTDDQKKWEDINNCAKSFFENTEDYDFKDFNIVNKQWKKICSDNYQPWRKCYRANINPCPHLYARYRTELRTEADVLDRVKDKCEKNKDPKKNPIKATQYPRRPNDPLKETTPTPAPTVTPTPAPTERTTRPWKRRKWNSCDDLEDRTKEFDLCTREFAEKLRDSTDKKSLCQDYQDMKNCHTREAAACGSLVHKRNLLKKDARGVYHNMDHVYCQNHEGYDPDHRDWARDHEPQWHTEPIPPPYFSWENRGYYKGELPEPEKKP